MGIADFDSGTWIDKWFWELEDPELKLLFIYLWTNSHKLLTGLYNIPVRIVESETGIKDVKEKIKKLAPKVLYDNDLEVVFIVNHVRRQFMRTSNLSPKIIVGIEKALRVAPSGHPFVDIFLSTYPTISSPPIVMTPDRVSGYPTSEGEGKGEGSNGKEKPATVAVRTQYSDDFQEFWANYPTDQRKGKGLAFKTWKKKQLHLILDDILKALESQKQSADWQKEGGKYIPHATTWLNQDRWDDDAGTTTVFEQSSPIN